VGIAQAVVCAEKLAWIAALLQSSSGAKANIAYMSVTLAMFQLSSGWLNDEAYLNIAYMVVTLAVFQLASGWLNDPA